METEKKWEEMTWEEKREVRFKKWFDAPGVEFKDAQARKNYQERVTRYIKVIKLEEPDRVPVNLPAGYLPASYAGYSLGQVMYDYDKGKPRLLDDELKDRIRRFEKGPIEEPA